MADANVVLRRKRKKEQGTEGGLDKDFWMVTFGDLLQLLITFFVLLISMSSMDSKVFKEMFAVFTGGIGELNMTGRSRLVKPDFKPEINPASIPADAFKKLLRLDPANTTEQKKLEEIVESLMVSGVEFLPMTDQFVMALPEDAMFEPGQIKINEGLKPVLDRIGFIMELSNNKIEIRGHTDDTPTYGRYYKSNWELSAARAVSVLQYFLEQGVIEPQRIEAKGYASYQPRVKNVNETYRKRNRRIEIVIKQMFEESY